MLQNFYKLSYTRGISQGRLSIEIVSMATRVVEFSNGGYKIRKSFA